MGTRPERHPSAVPTRTYVQQSTVALPSIGAISRYAIFTARADGRVKGYRIANDQSIAASDATYWTAKIEHKDINGGSKADFGVKTSKVTGGEGVTAYKQWGPDTDVAVKAGDSLWLHMTPTGTPGQWGAPAISLFLDPT